MSLGDWFGSAATATVATSATPSAQHRPPVATVASVAVANSGKDVPEHWRWRIVFADGRAIEVRYVPDVQRKEVEAHYPGTKVEPLADTDTWRPPTAAERAELVRLIALVYAGDTDSDRAEALAAALADPDSALICYRALVTEHGTMARFRLRWWIGGTLRKEYESEENGGYYSQERSTKESAR